MDERHAVITAMCDALHGKAANHKKMRRVAMLRAFRAAQQFYALSGYEHYTPEFVQAIRDTCSTQADRAGQTQDEVFETRAALAAADRSAS